VVRDILVVVVLATLVEALVFVVFGRLLRSLGGLWQTVTAIVIFAAVAFPFIHRALSLEEVLPR
jgi:hypothetical protein